MHKLKITLSERLGTLQKFWSGEKHIWDIGCDHADLGLSFVGLDQRVESLTLVDPSLAVIDSLKNKVKNIDSYITKLTLNIVHQKGQNLTVPHSNNLFFIAGMGGKEIFEIVSHLLPQIDESSSIVISPHRKILELRRELNKMPIILLQEMVISENEQFYPIFHLKKGEGRKVSLYGDEIWKSTVGKTYYNHQMTVFSGHKDELSQEYFEYLKSLND